MINIFLLLYDIMWSKLKLLILYKIVGCWNHVILLDQQWSKKQKRRNQKDDMSYLYITLQKFILHHDVILIRKKSKMINLAYFCFKI